MKSLSFYTVFWAGAPFQNDLGGVLHGSFRQSLVILCGECAAAKPFSNIRPRREDELTKSAAKGRGVCGVCQEEGILRVG